MAKPRFAPGMNKVPNKGCSGGNSQRQRDEARQSQQRGSSWRGDAKAVGKSPNTGASGK